MHSRRTFASLIFIMLIVCTYEESLITECVPSGCRIRKSKGNISGMLCSCHSHMDPPKLVCSTNRYKSNFKPFNLTVQEYSYYLHIQRQITFNGLNNEIPFKVLSEFTPHCFRKINSLVIANFCPIDSKTSTKFNLFKVMKEQSENLKFLNITNSCVTSLAGNIEDYFYRLKELHLSFNRFTQIPKFNSKLPKLRVLDVSNNFISNISTNAFKYIPALESLNISHNHLSTLDNPFKLNLKVLDLSHNHISELSYFTNHSFNLERLYLNNNNFTILPEYFFYSTQKLIHLDLSNNKVKSLRYDFEGLLRIETIYLNSVRLPGSDNELVFRFSVTNLKMISLTHNGLTQLPFIHLRTKTIFIDLRWNNITTLDLPPMTRIYYANNASLDVSHNCIQIFNTSYHPKENHEFLYYDPTVYDYSDLYDYYDYNLSNSKYIPQWTILQSFRCSFCCLKVIHPLMLFNLHKLIDLSHNAITELDLIGLSNNQPITINVSHNQIINLLNKNYELWSNISVLDISYNNLTSLVNLSVTPNLEKLYLNNNSLSEFNSIIEDLLSSNATDVRLAGNPWNCNCKIMTLVIKSSIFSDRHSLTCVKNGLLYHLADIDRLCSSEKRIIDLTLLWLLIPVSIIVTIIIACSLYYRFKAEIRYFMFSRGICLKFVTEKDIDDDKVYDAFISYCHEDEEWVADFLMTGLETGTPAYKLCLHNRDWLGGEYIPDQIVKSVQSSRRTIIVLTENFVKSVWSRMEFDVAYQQTMKDKIPRLIVVLPGDVPDLSEVSNEFKTFIKMTTYVQASKPHFWRKLRASMPRTMNLLQNKEEM